MFIFSLVLALTAVSVPVSAEDGAFPPALNDETLEESNGTGTFDEGGENLLKEIPAAVTSPGAITVTVSDTAQPEPDDGLAYTFEDLQSMLAEGDTVTLGAGVTVPEGETLTVDGAASINTGGAGIRVEGFLDLWDGAVITGEGVSQPIVEIAAGGYLLADSYDSGFETSPHITATGDGGLALLLREDISENHVSDTTFLRVSASGAGAVAVRSEASCRLFRYFIDATDGTGVVCPEDVSLFLCKITAGTAAVEAPDFTADTSVLSPADDTNGTFINRKIAQDSCVRVFVKQGEPVPEAEAGWALFAVTLRAGGYEDDSTMLGAAAVLPEIDTNVTGIYPFGIALDECWAAFDFLSEDVTLIAAEVYDPAIPYFRDAVYYFGTFYVDYNFDGELGGLTLWRSDDEGESWYDYTGDAGIDHSAGYIVTLPFYEQPESPVWLVWEAEGIGESEVLRLSFEDGAFSSDFGGDRIGVGRGETELPEADSVDEDSFGDENFSDDEDGNNDGYGDYGGSDNGNGSDNNSDSDNNNGSGYTRDQRPVFEPVVNAPLIVHAADLSPTPPTETPTPETAPPLFEDAAFPAENIPANGLRPTPAPVTPTADSKNGMTVAAAEPTPLPTLETPAGTEPSEAVTAVEGSNMPAPTSTAVSPALSLENTPEPIVNSDGASDGRGVTVSAEYLAAMIDTNPGSVPFFNGGLRVLLPGSWLQGLNLTGTDTFTVSLWRPEENSFAVSFAVNGKTAGDAFDEPFLLSLPWEGGAVSCVSADGETIDSVLAGDRAEFALFKPGTYTLAEKVETASVIADESELSPTGLAASEIIGSTDSLSELPAPQTKPNGWTAALLIGGLCLTGAGTAIGVLRKRRVKKSG